MIAILCTCRVTIDISCLWTSLQPAIQPKTLLLGGTEVSIWLCKCVCKCEVDRSAKSTREYYTHMQREALDLKKRTYVQVGLGTDVAGGYSPSMLSAMCSAVVAAKAVRMLRTDRARIAALHASRPEYAAQPNLASAPVLAPGPELAPAPDGAAQHRPAAMPGSAGQPNLASVPVLAPAPELAPAPDVAARHRPAAPDAPPAERRPREPDAAAASAAGRAASPTDQGTSHVGGPVPDTCAAERAAAAGQGTASNSHGGTSRDVNSPVPGSSGAQHGTTEGRLGIADGSSGGIGTGLNESDSGFGTAVVGAERAEESCANGNAAAGPRSGSVASDGCCTGIACAQLPDGSAEMPDQGCLQDPGKSQHLHCSSLSTQACCV